MHSDLSQIFLTAGVNESGEGFITVACHTSDGQIFLGQLDPDEVRTMGLYWISAAEAAEQDAAVLRAIRELKVPEEVAVALVTELRNGREV